MQTPGDNARVLRWKTLDDIVPRPSFSARLCPLPPPPHLCPRRFGDKQSPGMMALPRGVLSSHLCDTRNRTGYTPVFNLLWLHTNAPESAISRVNPSRSAAAAEPNTHNAYHRRPLKATQGAYDTHLHLPGTSEDAGHATCATPQHRGADARGRASSQRLRDAEAP